jgi:hypothetical protein
MHPVKSSGASPGVTRRFINELVNLRKSAVESNRSLKTLQHEAQMTRAVFKVRLEALVTERDALLRAQVRLADESTRLAIEVAGLKVRRRQRE